MSDRQLRRVVTLGETMALMSSETDGPLQHTRSLALGIGGSESNVAIALTRLGTPVTWIGRVGEDSLGDLVLREIHAEGVNVIGIRDPDAPTGLMVKERRTSSEGRLRIPVFRSKVDSQSGNCVAREGQAWESSADDASLSMHYMLCLDCFYAVKGPLRHKF